MPRTPEIQDPVFQRHIVILSGHGCLAERADINNAIKVPSRFTVTLWTWTKGTGVSPSMMLLDDAIGNMVDSGHFVEAYQLVNKTPASNDRRLPITYDAGDQIPNLMILPPRRNNTGTAAPGHRLHTVDRPGSLEDFLANLQRENQPVNLHWSACSELVTRRAQFGEINAGEVKNLFEVAKTYYWPKT
jgi:hypothetical protein